MSVNRSNLDSIESNKDLLALHNGAWASQDANRLDHMGVGQDKIVRIFSELMRNMSRMKTYIRPSMCKPYGKQSESLQKSKWILSNSTLDLKNKTPFCCSSHGYHTNCADTAKLSASSTYSRVVLEERERGKRRSWRWSWSSSGYGIKCTWFAVQSSGQLALIKPRRRAQVESYDNYIK